MKNILPLFAVLALLAGLVVANCAPPSLTPDPTATPSPVPTATPTPTPVPVTGVAFADASSSVVVGNDVTLAYVISPLNAANQGVSFSSDATGIATVNSSGVVHGVSAGTANITITTSEGNFTDVCPVTVSTSAILATGISIDATASVTAGSTVQLTKTLTPNNSTQSGDIVWSSDTTSVATVDTNGLVTGVVAGSAIITATVNGHSDTCTVTVNTATASAPTSSVATGMTVTNGSTITLTSPEGLSMRYVFGDDTVADPTSSSTQYSTAITIDRNMYIKAYAEGNGTTHSDSPVATFTYYVNDVANIGFEADTPSYFQNSTLTNGGEFFAAETSLSTGATAPDVTNNAPRSFAGNRALKIDATLATDTYNGTAVGCRVKFGLAAGTTGALATIPGTAAIPSTNVFNSNTGENTARYAVNNSGKTIRWYVAIYVPAGSPLDRFMFVLYDQNYNQFQAPVQPLVAGRWNYIVQDIEGSAASGTLVTNPTGGTNRNAMVVAAHEDAINLGANWANGSFDPSTIRYLGFKPCASGGTAGTAVTYYLDNIRWEVLP